MSNIERYTRVYCCLEDREATVGIEQRVGDDLYELANLVKCDVRLILRRLQSTTDWISLAQDEMERMILEWFPDRAFFFEFEEDGIGVQVYNPFQLPRSNQ